jgi:hypothetical protein
MKYTRAVVFSRVDDIHIWDGSGLLVSIQPDHKRSEPAFDGRAWLDDDTAWCFRVEGKLRCVTGKQLKEFALKEGVAE